MFTQLSNSTNKEKRKNIFINYNTEISLYKVNIKRPLVEETHL